MNNLFATWHHGAGVDLGEGPQLDVAGEQASGGGAGGTWPSG